MIPAKEMAFEQDILWWNGFLDRWQGVAIYKGKFYFRRNSNTGLV
jgi:hypothetical protein